MSERRLIGWNLGNSLDAIPDEEGWGNPRISYELIRAIGDKGFGIIRIPVTWHCHIGQDGKIDPGWMARVAEVVGYAISVGLKVILNVHHDEEMYIYAEDDGFQEGQNWLENVWRQIAAYFKDYDRRQLVFETMNEPRVKGSQNEWNGGTECVRQYINRLNSSIVNIIRASGGENGHRLIMCPGHAAAVPRDDFILPPGDNVAVSVHLYLPYAFALDREHGRADFTDADKVKIREKFIQLSSRFASKGIPVIIGETGAINRGNDESRVQWAEYFVSTATEFGLTCVIWDNGNLDVGGESCGLIDRNKLSWTHGKVVDSAMKRCNPISFYPLMVERKEEPVLFSWQNEYFTIEMPSLISVGDDVLVRVTVRRQLGEGCLVGCGLHMLDVDGQWFGQTGSDGTPLAGKEGDVLEFRFQKVAFSSKAFWLAPTLFVAPDGDYNRRIYESPAGSSAARILVDRPRLDNDEYFSIETPPSICEGDDVFVRVTLKRNLPAGSCVGCGLHMLGVDGQWLGQVGRDDAPLMGKEGDVLEFHFHKVSFSPKAFWIAPTVFVAPDGDYGRKIHEVPAGCSPSRILIRGDYRVIDGVKYRLTFEDQFESDTLDRTKWILGDQPRQNIGGRWSPEMVEQKDGRLFLLARLSQDGQRPLSGAVKTKGLFEQCEGYFECRCEFPHASCFWGAFWMMCGDVCFRYPYADGTEGTEIDIIESGECHHSNKSLVNHALHWNGYDIGPGKLQSVTQEVPAPSLYSGFHVYALKWTSTEYVFYIDGRETWRTNKPGMCKRPGYLKLSTEFGSWTGDPIPNQLPDKMTIDFVRAYQVNES